MKYDFVYFHSNYSVNNAINDLAILFALLRVAEAAIRILLFIFNYYSFVMISCLSFSAHM